MINCFSVGEETEISSLVLKVFDEFIGFEYSETGRNNFRNFASSESILKRHIDGNILLTYKIDKKIVGFIEVRENKHICLFFVDPSFHHKGIGRILMKEIISQLTGKTASISVNSSKYAEPVYKKLGFETIDKIQEKDGIIFIPMVRPV